MTERISDATLGRRFWAVNDFNQIQAPHVPNVANVEEAENRNRLDPNILNFVNAGGDTMAQSAINKAQIFAANHTFGVEEVQREEDRTIANRQTLVGEEAEVNNLVDEVAAVFAQRHDGVA